MAAAQWPTTGQALVAAVAAVGTDGVPEEQTRYDKLFPLLFSNTIPQSCGGGMGKQSDVIEKARMSNATAPAAAREAEIVTTPPEVVQDPPTVEEIKKDTENNFENTKQDYADTKNQVYMDTKEDGDDETAALAKPIENGEEESLETAA